MPSLCCVVACTDSCGIPVLFGCKVQLTETSHFDDDAVGWHYEAAKKLAESAGFCGPFVCFDEADGPNWLFNEVFQSNNRYKDGE